jgi:putative DNA primase/helicase
MQKSQSQSPEKTQVKVAHDTQLVVSTAASHTAKKWKPQQVTWSGFVNSLAQPRVTGETFEEYKKMSRVDQTRIKASAGAFVGGALHQGTRKKGSVKFRQLIALDLDNLDNLDFWDNAVMFNDFAMAMYSTHKHTSEKPRVRLLVPLAEAVQADQYEAIARKLAADYFGGLKGFDPTTFEPERLMFFPTVSTDAEYIFEYEDAPLLDPARILAEYEDWTDVLSWAAHEPLSDKHRAEIAKQENPRGKKGVVGAFCRAYDIHEAIEHHISDKYESTGYNNRYTYVEGTTMGGLVVYSDNGYDDFAYSHHSTDPAATGHVLNAFDLVRVHKFSELDAELEGDHKGNNLSSYQAMLDFALNDAKVKQLMFDEQLSGAQDDFEDELTTEGEEKAAEDANAWAQKLERAKSGEIIQNARNIELIIKNMVLPSVKYNDFKKCISIVAAPIWEPDRVVNKPETWSDMDNTSMYHFFAKTFDIEKRNLIDAAFTDLVKRERFNPILDNISSVKWDGVKRAEALFIDYLGAEDNVYTREVTLKWLQHAIKRLVAPGCAFPVVPVLEGSQGAGKSLLASRLALAPEWFTDAVTDFRDQKKAGELLQGRWIAELSELSAMRYSDIEATKAFISKTHDAYRGAYERYVSEYPRQSVFIATTNEDTYLRDRTGNRRYWPVKCDVSNRTKVVKDSFDYTEAQQVWAEVYEMGVENISFELSSGAQALAEAARSEKMVEDPTRLAVEDYILGLEEKPQFINAEMVAEGAWNVIGRNPSNAEYGIIKNVLESNGYKQAMTVDGKGNPVKARKRLQKGGSYKHYWKLQD